MIWSEEKKFLLVKEVNPLKQGLKHQLIKYINVPVMVKEVNPLKQGLKPSPLLKMVF